MAVGSVKNVLKILFGQPVADGCVRFYRGHVESQWDLLPSILRGNNIHHLSNERKIISELHIKYPQSFIDSKNIFEDLVIAQHYEVPTRLLDVTTNPLVALFFACDNKRKNTGNAELLIFDVPKDEIVYYDDKIMIQELESSLGKNTESDFKSPHVTCVKARLNNPRISRQFGAFMLFTKGGSEHGSIMVKPKRIEISKSHTKIILSNLRELGIGKDTLFPEIPKYAECLKKGEIKL